MVQHQKHGQKNINKQDTAENHKTGFLAKKQKYRQQLKQNIMNL
jgi:hypothetical protein